MSSNVLMLLDNPFKSDARVEKEAISLVKAGYTVTVLAVKDSALPELETRDGYTIKRMFTWQFNSPLKSGFKAYIENVSTMIAQEDFHLLHCHDFYMLYIGSWVKQKKPSIKLIYDSHEYLVGWPFYRSNKGLLNQVKGYFVWQNLIANERKAIQFADSVITITSAIAERLQKNNSLNKLPHIVSNFPNSIAIDSETKYFHKKYALDQDVKVMVHSGTIYHTNEQLFALFNFIAEIKQLVVVFIGNRPRFEEVKQLVEAKPEWKAKVFFHPYLANQTAMINLMSSADIGLMHIRDEWEAHKIGFSNRFVEYALAGLPVVATPQEFTRQVNEVYPCCTFYQENSTASLAKAIREMLTNLDTYRANVSIAKKDFNWHTEEAKLLDIYAQLSQ
jgi:glycosyltransferase involved in cell wall biosynthesis